MSHRYEFTADVESESIPLPPEIASRMRHQGVGRVFVVLTSVADEEARLAGRGITAEEVDGVAERQKIARDLAITVLSGEGSAEGDLAERLRALGR